MNLFAEIKTLLLRHWDLKLIALTLAVILRLVVVGDKDVERLMANVRLEFRNLPPGIEIVKPIRNRFDVLFFAPAGKQVQQSDLAVVVDMKEAKLGSHVFILDPSSIIVPEGVEALGVSPSRLVIRLEKTLQKNVQVSPVLEGTVAPGHEIYEVNLDPAEVTIAGPASLVQRMTKVLTESILVEGLNQSTSMVVNVMEDSESVRLEQMDPIVATIKIREKR